MPLNRREFLKASAFTTMAGALTGLGFDLSSVKTYAASLSIRTARETTTICPYCAVGCGLIIHTDKSSGKIINTEGDPEHPINEGALCAKGAALFQVAVNPNRITNVLYRAPFSDKWETKSWGWAWRETSPGISPSKVGFTYLVRALEERGYSMVDCQMHTPHLESLGAEEIDREDFLALLGMARKAKVDFPQSLADA